MSAPTVRGPDDLPDLRLYLLHQWRPGGPLERASSVLPEKGWGGTQARVRPFWEWETGMLGKASLWWVSEDMVDLLLAAWHSMPGDVRWPDLHPPTQAGFVMFEKPIIGHDAVRPDHPVQVDAVLWGGTMLSPIPGTRHSSGVAALTTSSYRRFNFTDGLTPDDLALATATQAFTQATSTHMVGVVDHGTAAVSPGDVAYSLTGEAWVPLGRSDWPEGDPLEVPPLEGLPPETVESFLEDRRLIAGLWALATQPRVSTVIHRQPPRAARRRHERAGLDLGTSGVRVVTLRQAEHPHEPGEDGHRDVEWSRRWFVEPHWRNQPHGPGRTLRRLQLIPGHIKGPADKPFVKRETVRAWVRP